jgi:hypothetical protein
VERGARFSALLVLGSLAAACHSAPPSAFPTADAALERMREGGSCSRAVQGEASLNYMGGGMGVSGKLLYLAAAPAQLRFDVYHPIVGNISTLTSDGERFELFDLRNKTFLEGPATTCNVERFTRVPVPPTALVELLRGQAPVLAHTPDAARIEWQSGLFGGGHYLLELSGANEARQEIELEPHPDDWERPYGEQRVRVTSVRVWQEQAELYHVELAGHEKAERRPPVRTAEEIEMGIPPLPPSGPECSAELPRRMRISAEGQSLVIRTDEVWHNPAFARGVFRQPVPSGVTRRAATCN